MPVHVKIEDNFEPYYKDIVIPCHHPPAEKVIERKIKLKVEKEEEDSKLPAVDNTNPPPLQAN